MEQNADSVMDSVITTFGSSGLTGAVIGALFYLIHSNQKELRAMNESTDKRIDEQANRHNAERQQWLEQLEKFGDILRGFSSKQCGFELRKKASE